MEPRVSSPTAHRQLRPQVAALSLLIPMLAVNAGEGTSLYRCIAPDGKVEFRQTACTQDAEEQKIRVQDRKTGWEPAKTKIEKKPKRSKKSRASKRKSKKDSSDRARQEKQCWKKRQQIEEVNWKLRRGYKPAAGVKLRRKRKKYEDYIRQFCK